jgi:hypothetical protein
VTGSLNHAIAVAQSHLRQTRLAQLEVNGEMLVPETSCPGGQRYTHDVSTIAITCKVGKGALLRAVPTAALPRPAGGQASLCPSCGATIARLDGRSMTADREY